MATASSRDGNTLRDRSTHQLKELNARTDPLGAFGVSVYRPKTDTYSYKDKRTQAEKQGATFRFILVLRDNQQQYIRAEIPKKVQT